MNNLVSTSKAIQTDTITNASNISNKKLYPNTCNSSNSIQLDYNNNLEELKTYLKTIQKNNCKGYRSNFQDKTHINNLNETNINLGSEINDVKKLLEFKSLECNKSEKKVVELKQSNSILEQKIVILTNENIELKKKREQAKQEIINLNNISARCRSNSKERCDSDCNRLNTGQDVNSPINKEQFEHINIIKDLSQVYKDLVNLIVHIKSKESRDQFIQIENNLNQILSNLKENANEEKESVKNNKLFSRYFSNQLSANEASDKDYLRKENTSLVTCNVPGIIPSLQNVALNKKFVKKLLKSKVTDVSSTKAIIKNAPIKLFKN